MSKYARGESIKPIVECPKYDTKDYTDVPYLETIATYDEENEEVAVFIVNRSLNEDCVIDFKLLDFDGYKPVAFESMDGYDKLLANDFGKETVCMHTNELPVSDDGVFKANLKSMSFNVIRFKK